MKQRTFTKEFKRKAVRILTTSGRSIFLVATDLGIGKSTLDRWRKENELLRQERELLKKQRPSSLELRRIRKQSMKFLSLMPSKTQCLCHACVRLQTSV